MVTDLEAEYFASIILNEAESLLHGVIGGHVDGLEMSIVSICAN